VCDLFHLPILNLIDNPGFSVGLEHETAGTIRKGGEWMVAVRPGRGADVLGADAAQLRRRRQQPGDADPPPNVRVTWPAPDVGRHPAEGGIEAAYKRQLAEAEDPVALARRARCPDRERPRPDRTPQPVPDRGADRSAR
jgi:acetyl-CoA carboxylase carboxyltransferase component